MPAAAAHGQGREGQTEGEVRVMLAFIVLAIYIGVQSAAGEPERPASPPTCAECGRRGLSDQWLAWHVAASHPEVFER